MREVWGGLPAILSARSRPVSPRRCPTCAQKLPEADRLLAPHLGKTNTPAGTRSRLIVSDRKRNGELNLEPDRARGLCPEPAGHKTDRAPPPDGRTPAHPEALSASEAERADAGA